MQTRTTEPRPTAAPTWEQYWSEIDNADYLTARALIELHSPIRRHFEQFPGWDEDPVLVNDPNDSLTWIPDPEGAVWRGMGLDWSAAARTADEWACSWTERRLLDLVLSLIQPDLDHDGTTTGARLVDLRTLSELGTWRHDVAEIIGRYVTEAP